MDNQKTKTIRTIRKKVFRSMTKSKRGGARKNAGAKPKYDEKTQVVSFRCPISKIGEIKTLVNNKMNEWVIIVKN